MLGGIYILKHPYEQDVYKIGASVDIGSRINSGSYVTMFSPDNPVKFRELIDLY